MSKKVLIVDDDEGILDALSVIVEIAGYEVLTCQDGETVEKLLEDQQELPDLILLDMLLSGRDGRILCKQLKKLDKTKHIPIIMLSAHPKAEIGIEECGADAFISKPFKMNDLLEKVEYFLSSK
jgi:DNA-binding response OmpR family regulator